MRELMRYAAALEDVDAQGLPPVEQWRPDRVGAIDIVIKADGMWHHEGTPINRAKLARLFSTILRRDGDAYFLVTPAEKLKITVEDVPFLAVDMETNGESALRRLTFKTNLGDSVDIGPGHKLVFRPSPTGQITPYIEVRRGLEARITTAVYYDFVALAERRHMEGGEVLGVWSGGVFFPFADGENLGD